MRGRGYPRALQALGHLDRARRARCSRGGTSGLVYPKALQRVTGPCTGRRPVQGTGDPLRGYPRALG
eukprot:NODE_2616_length_1077_cov_4.769455_g2178_i0.p5 GENE.NODE_2616_length_1077_cov_4.769455_g2178_i0~~NODE_2616_length_1077_cov_4.769455_g2178_i0.p5  ORF type:complete len:67 (+),score=2.85 NODE_2616_length_1077_cov_4.769455_g2178_i0:595-795(+)